jgi:hypothetical protein
MSLDYEVISVNDRCERLEELRDSFDLNAQREANGPQNAARRNFNDMYRFA